MVYYASMICRSCSNDVDSYTHGKLCRSCYNEHMRVYMLDRYHRRRKEWVTKLGGLCIDCGSQDNLEFDHSIASSKTFNIAKALAGFSEKRIVEEMSKCVLRCKSCHIKKSLTKRDMRIVDHGEGKTGKYNCRCDLCRPLKNAYAREHKNKRKNQVPIV